MTALRGRGGRVIVVDESRARALSEALTALPHFRDVDATQPIEPVLLPSLTWWERLEERLDRVWEAIDRRAIWWFLGLFLTALLGVAIFGVIPRG